MPQITAFVGPDDTYFTPMRGVPRQILVTAKYAGATTPVPEADLLAFAKAHAEAEAPAARAETDKLKAELARVTEDRDRGVSAVHRLSAIEEALQQEVEKLRAAAAKPPAPQVFSQDASEAEAAAYERGRRAGVAEEAYARKLSGLKGTIYVTNSISHTEICAALDEAAKLAFECAAAKAGK